MKVQTIHEVVARPADLLHLAAGATADLMLDQAAIYLDIARLMLDHNIPRLGSDSPEPNSPRLNIDRGLVEKRLRQLRPPGAPSRPTYYILEADKALDAGDITGAAARLQLAHEAIAYYARKPEEPSP